MANAENRLLEDKKISRLSSRTLCKNSLFIRSAEGKAGLTFSNLIDRETAFTILGRCQWSNIEREDYSEHHTSQLSRYHILFNMPKYFNSNDKASRVYIWMILTIIARFQQLEKETKRLNPLKHKRQLKEAKIEALSYFLRGLSNLKDDQAIDAIKSEIMSIENNSLYRVAEQAWLEKTWMRRIILFFWGGKGSRTQRMFDEVKLELSKLDPPKFYRS